MAAKVSIDPKSLSEFVEACRQFAAGMKLTMRDAMLEQAMFACQDAANFTPPLVKGGGGGLSASAHKAGLGAVAGDITKIFTAANDMTAKSTPGRVQNQIAFAVKSNDFGAFNQILSGSKVANLFHAKNIMSKIVQDADRQRAFSKAKNFLNRATPIKTEYGVQGYVTDIRQVHDQIKGRFGGRIKKGQKPVGAKLLVEDKDELKDYILRRQRMVGAVKSGWATCMRGLPKLKEPNGQQGEPGAELRKASWITMHSSVVGTNTTNFTDKIVEISINNSIGNINTIADEAGVLGLVYGNRVKQMPAMMRYRMRKPINKFNKK